MKTFLFSLLLVLCGSARAQVTKGTLQASGLTCSMCSKAVKNALDKVSFIERVQVDIKNQQYTIYFKEGSQVDLDAVSKAVENAGFSVARLVVTAAVNGLKLEKEAHIKIGDFYFHILNATDQQLNVVAAAHSILFHAAVIAFMRIAGTDLGRGQPVHAIMQAHYKTCTYREVHDQEECCKKLFHDAIKIQRGFRKENLILVRPRISVSINKCPNNPETYQESGRRVGRRGQVVPGKAETVCKIRRIQVLET